MTPLEKYAARRLSHKLLRLLRRLRLTLAKASGSGLSGLKGRAGKARDAVSTARGLLGKNTETFGRVARQGKVTDNQILKLENIRDLRKADLAKAKGTSAKSDKAVARRTSQRNKALLGLAGVGGLTTAAVLGGKYLRSTSGRRAVRRVSRKGRDLFRRARGRGPRAFVRRNKVPLALAGGTAATIGGLAALSKKDRR